MPDFIDISLLPSEAEDPAAIEQKLLAAGKSTGERYMISKRSIDARKKPVIIRMRCAVYASDENPPVFDFEPVAKNVANAPEVFIAGSGPCGLFAALQLIECGFKPIILERGKDVRARRRDLAKLNKEHIVNPDSNYCFGEGGAGTYSDGKLYTRSKKRGSVNRILNTLVYFGAPQAILVDAHPHIGTNKLPKIITEMRNFIESCGGEVRFDTRLTDMETQGGKIHKIQVNESEWISCKSLILATGHSARDIFHILHRRGILIEAKPFALGVRVEHPQEIIDRIQYNCDVRSPYLPPASYNLVQQVNNRGVYSFCMCPGGIIAPCATAPGEIVTNGWSPSKRNNPFANSGLVVSIDESLFDPQGKENPLAALEYQQKVENKAWELGGKTQTAPAQRIVDFVQKKQSANLPRCSYQPGIQSAELRDCLPHEVSSRLQEALKSFGKKMKGYYTNEAVLVATESRTSSPVRIPRNRDFSHVEIAGLYPAGEGAGYAGGIVSAAIDGQKVAEAIAALVAPAS